MSQREGESRGESPESIWKPLWSDLSNKIDRELPGEPLWSQAIPIENGDLAEGIAIRREGDPNGGGGEASAAWHLLVYFRLVPVSVGPGEAGEMVTHQLRSGVPGGSDATADDWEVEVGYQEPFDTLQEAKDEAGKILADLPIPEHMEARGYDFFLKLLKPEDA